MIINKNIVTKPQINHHFVFRALFGVVLVFLFFVAGTFLTVRATAGINRVINFQGKLVNKTDGTNITDGNYSFTFRFYDAASSGTLLPSGTGWSETQVLGVTNGIFRAGIGSSVAIPSTLDFNSNSIYLDITFNGESFTSRVQMAAVPYAFNAEKVGGLTVSNTTGGLTVANGAVLNFGNSFSSGSNALTFSTTGTTGLTLPTSGTLTTGNGLSNYLARWTSSGNLSTGISYDNGTSVGIGYTNVNSAGALLVNGNVGIGLTNPVNKLDVLGAVSIGFNGRTAASSNGLIVLGNVGIGNTSSTGYALDVTGTIRGTTLESSGPVKVGVTTAASSPHLCLDSSNFISACSGGGGSITGTGVGNYLARWTSSTNISTGVAYDDGTSVGIGYTNTNSSGKLVVNGNVGIGLTNPVNKLDVLGAVSIGFNGATVAPTNGLIILGNVGIGNTSSTGYALDVAGAVRGTTLESSGPVKIGVTTAASSNTLCLDSNGFVSACNVGGGSLTGTGAVNYLARWTSASNLSTGVVYDNGTSVGIGYANPDASTILAINGNVGIGTTIDSAHFALRGKGLTTGINFDAEDSNGVDKVVILDNGNVGIGTSAPLDRLDVTGSVVIGALPGAVLPQSNMLYVSGNLGIGNTNPSYQVDVTGSGRFTTGLYLGIDNSTNGLLTLFSSGAGETDPTIQATATGDLLLKAPSGSIILGTGPGSISFSLVGETDVLTAAKAVTLTGAYITDDFTFTRNNTGANFAQSGAVLKVVNTSSGASNASDMLLVNAAPSSGGTFTGSLLRLQLSGADKVFVNSLGNMGIGTTSPIATLDVSGTLRIGTTNAAVNTQTLCLGTNNIISACNAGGGSVTGTGLNGFVARWTSASNLSTGVIFDNGTSVGIGYTNLSAAEALAVNGNVAIGVTSNSARLTVRGAGTTTGLGFHVEDSNGADHFVILDNGNVGIGTTSPGDLLDLAGTNGGIRFGGTGQHQITTLANTDLNIIPSGNLTLGNTGASGNYTINIGSGTSTPTINIGTGNTASHVIFAAINGVPAAAAGSASWSNGEFHIGYSAAVAAGGRIWIKAGNSVFTFRSAARGALADYSEYMKQEIPSESEPGDIMVMSQSGTGKVTRSSFAYDSNLAGAVTTGERGTSNNDLDFDNFSETGSHQGSPDWANVGMLGQVYVKVSTENGRVVAGDPITTSSQKGIGMKATEAGRIVGWALQSWDGSQSRDERAPQQPLPSGVGMILVYVNPTYYTTNMDRPDQLVFDPQNISDSAVYDMPIVAYRIKNAAGNIIRTTSSFAESVIGNLRAGSIQSKDFISEKATINLAKINFIEAQTISTDLLKAKGLVITGDDGLDKIVFDNKGNAFFAGTVTADTIKARHIEGLDILAGKISTIEGEVAGLSTVTPDADVASMSALLANTTKRVDDLDKRVTDLEKMTFVPTASQEAIFADASSSANLDSKITLNKDLIVNNNLTVLGKTNLNELGVIGDITAGVLVMNGLDTQGGANIYTLSGSLKLQASALGDVEMMKDLIHFDTKGNVNLREGDIVLEKGKIRGNDSFTGNITIPHGATKVVVEKAWDSIPVSVITTPSFNGRAWVTDVTKDGFTINIDNPETEDKKLYWVAFFGFEPTPSPSPAMTSHVP